MPARSFGYAEVEERLQEIRRRLNLLVIQRGVFAAASAILLTATLLLVVALFSASSTFRLSLWLALPALVGVLALVARFAVRQLVSLEATARFADRQARLQDRLATLHAHGRARSSSRLVDLLLAEALNLSPRWRVSALGLRRVSRSIYSMLASLLLLGAAAFFGPASEPEAEARPQPRPQERKAPPQNENREEAAAQRLLLRTSTSDRMAGGDGTGAGPGGRDGAGNKAKTRSVRASSNASPSTASEGGGEAAAAGDQEVGNDTAARLQQMIRNTLGHSGEQADGARQDRPAPGSGAPGHRRTRQNGDAAGDAKHSDSKSDAGNKAPDGAKKLESGGAAQAANTAQGSKSAREGGSSASGELLGAGKPSAAEPADSQKFALRLNGASTMHMRIEPQGKGEPGVRTEARGTEGEASLPEVAEQEAPDGALHRAEISPEHEAILRRIFLRD